MCSDVADYVHQITTRPTHQIFKPSYSPDMYCKDAILSKYGITYLLRKTCCVNFCKRSKDYCNNLAVSNTKIVRLAFHIGGTLYNSGVLHTN